MHRRSALLTVAGILTGCASTRSSDVEYDVGMGASFFRPETIEIAAGETVNWLNTGSRAHSVTAYEARIPEEAPYFASGGFASETEAREAWAQGKGLLYADERYSHRFEVPGTYHYFCIPHERAGMRGTVVVTD